ncbi:hypothetical protein BN2476_600051 [Paraburkholderia piptadeniae]|uniref:Uncharacterized protein n=1 Tax=Paraburkholderia piptadeniae TaxID=1701573 RepID=A0A1N7SKK0_9BURK|nr:hypothetical protein BN2476_600051 [Paraburkholderia piptadeniae]
MDAFHRHLCFTTPIHTVCGILMHSSLAVTTQGIALGLAAIRFAYRSRRRKAIDGWKIYGNRQHCLGSRSDVLMEEEIAKAIFANFLSRPMSWRPTSRCEPDP